MAEERDVGAEAPPHPSPLTISVVTLFPEVFEPYLSASITGRARQAGKVEFGLVQLRDFTHDRHNTVDDYPYGGGAGMVLKPDPFFEAVESLVEGGVFDGQDVVGALTDPAGDGVAMHRFPGQRFEDQDVERSLEEVHVRGGRWDVVAPFPHNVRGDRSSCQAIRAWFAGVQRSGNVVVRGRPNARALPTSSNVDSDKCDCAGSSRSLASPLALDTFPRFYVVYQYITVAITRQHDAIETLSQLFS